MIVSFNINIVFRLLSYTFVNNNQYHKRTDYENTYTERCCRTGSFDQSGS